MKTLLTKVKNFIAWNYRYGDTFNFLTSEIKMPEAELARQPAILERPELNWLFEQPYVEAFYTLCSSRQFATGGIATIPISEILIYWDHYTLGEMDDFVHIIKDVDNAYVKMWYDDPANKPSEGVKK